MMSENKPKEKKVNFEKLKLMSDDDLKDRADIAATKIEAKKKRYFSLHDLNLARLNNYEKYRLADKAVCLKLLAERKTKQSLPSGNLGKAVGAT